MEYKVVGINFCKNEACSIKVEYWCVSVCIEGKNSESVKLLQHFGYRFLKKRIITFYIAKEAFYSQQSYLKIKSQKCEIAKSK